MSQKGLLAGFYASILALFFGGVTGGLGMWSVVASAARTTVGGWLVLLVVGSIAGYLYSYFGFNKLFGKEVVVKGAAFGALIWIISLILTGIFPALGKAAFADPIRVRLFLQLLTSLVWGASLGLFYEKI